MSRLIMRYLRRAARQRKEKNQRNRQKKDKSVLRPSVILIVFPNHLMIFIGLIIEAMNIFT